MSWRSWFRSETIAASSHQAFWKWFTEHEVEFLDFEADHEIEREWLFDILQTQLKQVHSGLTFEFGPKGQTREFIISADGIKSAFPFVSALVAAAPKFERWQISGFRPRR